MSNKRNIKKQLFHFNNRHKDETIYIIGCSPDINNFSKEQLKLFKDKTTIGLNYCHTKIKNLSYMMTSNIGCLAYMLEYGPKNVPIFADYGEGTAYAKEVWDNSRVIKVSVAGPAIPFPRNIFPSIHTDVSKTALHGNTSILLSATNLAYVMGASKIVYIGIEEIDNVHHYNLDKKILSELTNNFHEILKSKKYWNPVKYSKHWQGKNSKENVHSSLECALGLCEGAPRSQQALIRPLEELQAEKFDIHGSNNYLNLRRYVEYLKSQKIEMSTTSTRGITVEANCQTIDINGIWNK